MCSSLRIWSLLIRPQNRRIASENVSLLLKYAELYSAIILSLQDDIIFPFVLIACFDSWVFVFSSVSRYVGSLGSTALFGRSSAPFEMLRPKHNSRRRSLSMLVPRNKWPVPELTGVYGACGCHEILIQRSSTMLFLSIFLWFYLNYMWNLSLSVLLYAKVDFWLFLICRWKLKNFSTQWQSSCQNITVKEQNQSLLVSRNDWTLFSKYQLWLLSSWWVHLSLGFTMALWSAFGLLRLLSISHSSRYHSASLSAAVQDTAPEGVLSQCWCHEILIQPSFNVLFMTRFCQLSLHCFAAAISQIEEFLHQIAVSSEDWRE